MTCPRCLERVPCTAFVSSSRFDPAVCPHCGASVWFQLWRYYVVYSFVVFGLNAIGFATGRHFFAARGISTVEAFTLVVVIWLAISALMITKALKLKETPPKGFLLSLKLSEKRTGPKPP